MVSKQIIEMLNYNALRKQPSYDEMVDAAHRPTDRIVVSRRNYTLLSNTAQVAQFRDSLELDAQKDIENIQNVKLQQDTIRRVATNTGQPAAVLALTPQLAPPEPDVIEMRNLGGPPVEMRTVGAPPPPPRVPPPPPP